MKLLSATAAGELQNSLCIPGPLYLEEDYFSGELAQRHMKISTHRPPHPAAAVWQKPTLGPEKEEKDWDSSASTIQEHCTNTASQDNLSPWRPHDSHTHKRFNLLYFLSPLHGTKRMQTWKTQ